MISRRHALSALIVTAIVALAKHRARSETSPPWAVVADVRGTDASFGRVVAMNSRLAIIGSSNGLDVLVRGAPESAASFQRSHLPRPTDATDSFATSIAMNEDTLVIGDPGAQAAWVFDVASTSPNVREKLVPSKASVEFGASVAIGMSDIAIGAPGSNVVHTFGGSTGVTSAPPGAVRFGAAVAFAPGLAVGSEGAVHLYRPELRDRIYWRLFTTLRADDAIAGDGFGESLVAGADLQSLLVGAPRHGAGGAVYVFTGPAQIVKLVPPTGSAFGSSMYFTELSLGASGRTPAAVIGADGASGAFFTFTSTNSTWTLDSSVEAPAEAKRFGRALAGDFHFALSGAEGTAFFVRRPPKAVSAVSYGDGDGDGCCRGPRLAH